MTERKLIYTDELDAALESAQKTLETNWEKQWKMNKGQVKGLAWARAILREAKSADVAAMLPKWISVEERLPEVEKRVLLLTEHKDEFSGKIYHNVTCGFYEDGKKNTENSKAYWDAYELDLEYNEELDAYLVPEGWVEECLEERDEITCMVLGYKVTHWMPLPEPPEVNKP